MVKRRVVQRSAQFRVFDPPPDRGPTGQAAMDRESRIITVGGGAKGSVATVATEVRRYACECHIDRLSARGQVTDRQWRAGTLFRRYWLAAHKPPRVTGHYGEMLPGGSGGDEVSAYRADARVKVREAEGAMPLDELMAVEAVCGHDDTIAGRLRKLQAGLNVLIDLWDVPADYCRPESRRRAISGDKKP